jgi:two-component system, OmpR family, KDP operon response regulator KdpE
MSGTPSILVVDDEPQIQLFVRHSLEASGYSVRQAGTAHAALRAMDAEMPDLVILDLGLPDLDGKAVIGQIRQTSDVPIIVLSAHDQEDEKIAALDLGANDFVAKPFGIGELLARIRASLRARMQGSEMADRIAFADLTIDVPAHNVSLKGKAVRLTPKEFDLLVLLARHPGRVLTHRQILAKVWGPAHVEDLPYLRVFVGQLRQKIEANPAEPQLIVTEPGVGYRFSPVIAGG